MLEASLNDLKHRKQFQLAGSGPWTIGRAAEAEFRFEDDLACSRQQASIMRRGDGFVIAQLSRSTPTLLNGRALEGEAPLQHGVVIGFAAQTLLFQQPLAKSAAKPAIAAPDAVSMKTVSAEGAAPVAAFTDYITLGSGVTLGRLAIPGQVVFDHPAISRRHAAFEVGPEGVTLRDLGSTNGTFVNGARLTGVRALKLGDRIDLGPFQLVFDGRGLQTSTRLGSAELTVTKLCKDVPKAGGKAETLRLLHGVSLKIRARNLVCIMGASGSGKSTLLNIVAGRSNATEGYVELNGQDLHENFSALKQDVAFVPQQDVLHEQLTLRQALDYAAQLRLPPDTTPAQRGETVEAAARNVDLFERLDTRIEALSGGQKKRASLAAEILGKPSLLFLDEVTSGLDESTDWEIMKLLRRLAEEGMTIVAVTHTLANVEEFCHEVICMGRGGHLTFAGTPADALAFFGAKRLGEVFNRMEVNGPAAWSRKFADLPITRPVPPTGDARMRRKMPHIPEPREVVFARAVRQFFILTHRNRRLLVNDRRTLKMAAVQSVLVGGLMGYAFESFGDGWQKVSSENALLMLLGFLALWLGCNGASKDIVGELVIFRRERDINLSTAAFVASKYVVSCVFAMLQLVAALLLVALFAESLPGSLPGQLLPLLVGCAAGTAIGLVISAFSNTRDQATTIVPLALVPQLILAGVLVPHLPALAALFAKLAVSGYWLTETMKSVFITAAGPILILDPKTNMLVAMTAQPVVLGLFMLVLHTAAFLAVAYWATLVRNGRRQK